MNENNLPDEAILELLYDRANSLQQTIADIDRDIARAISAHADGDSVSRSGLADIQSLYELKHEHVFKLGQASAHIEQILERVEQRQARSQEDQRQADTFAVLENHLDWLEVEMRRINDYPEEEQQREPEPYRR